MTEPFRPVPGRRYRTREGGVAVVTQLLSGGTLFLGRILYANSMNGRTTLWRINGSHNVSSKWDIVAFADDEPATDPASVIPVPSTQDQGGAEHEALTTQQLFQIDDMFEAWVGKPMYKKAFYDDAKRLLDIPPTKAPDVIAKAGASAEEAPESVEQLARTIRQATCSTSTYPFHVFRDGEAEANILEWCRYAARAALSVLSPRQPVAFITKTGLDNWQKGTDPEQHVLLRSGGDMRVPLYAKPPREAALDGWVLVPRDPTLAMIMAYDKVQDDLKVNSYANSRLTWPAMLAAAPKPPQTGGMR